MKRLLPFAAKALTASAIAMLAACGDDSSSGADESQPVTSGSSTALTCDDVTLLGNAVLVNVGGVSMLVYENGVVTDTYGNGVGFLSGTDILDLEGNVAFPSVDLSTGTICAATSAAPASSAQASVGGNVTAPASSAQGTSGVVPAPTSSATATPASSAATGSTATTTLPPVSYTSPVALATAKDPSATKTLYQAWKPFHFVTLEDESVYYGSISSEFNVVFPAKFSPAGRVIWSTQSTGGYKFQCQVEDATVSAMKYRGCTVSEGIGYGMLLTYFNDDLDAFTRLWNYSKGLRDYFSVKLTPWITKSFMYDMIDPSSATDADLDIATSLILMHYRTGKQEYLDDAISIATAIWDKEVNPSTFLLYSGDTEMWVTADPTYNLSYFSPVALRLFAKVDPAHAWDKVIDAMYAYMAKVQAGGTGVFPDWSNGAGVAVNPPNGAAGNEKTGFTWHTFNKESVRIPWRIAWDYYWNQDERALAVLTTLNKFISEKASGDPASIALATQYSWDPAKADATNNTSVPKQWLAAWCATGIGTDSAWLEKCTTLINAATVGNNGSSYFTDILLVMYSGLLNGNFAKPF
ncbi:MAG: glycosyl hydrolase family 8 [Fibrobacter sp.]|nr:glycosyl hydrolase family 8 [Fibrobacter sp.]